MKKNYLFFALILFTHNVFSQFIVYEEDEGVTPYVDYQVFETHSVDITLPSTTFDFRIKNIGNTNIKVRIKVESLINTNGDAEFCVNGLCSSPVFQGDIYPLNADYLEIQPGGLQPFANASKFGNLETGIDSLKPVDYVLKFYQIDDAGNEIGTPLHVTCRYTSNAVSVSNIGQADELYIYPNPAKDVITISNSSSEVADVKISDMSGRLVKQIHITGNAQIMDISGLNQGLYLVSLLQNKKIISQQKLIVK